MPSLLQRFIDLLLGPPAPRPSNAPEPPPPAPKPAAPEPDLERASLSELLARLADGSATLPHRERVARTLGARKDARAEPALRAALADPAPEVRAAAASALMQLGQAALVAVPALIQALSDPDARVRGAAVAALVQGWIRPPPAKVVPELVQVLAEDASAAVRREAVSALASHLPNEAALSLPTLLRALSDAAPEVRRAAVNAAYFNTTAFRERAPADLLAALEAPLVAALSDADDYCRRAAALALSQLHPASAPARASLLGLLEKPDLYSVREVVEGLGRLSRPEVLAELEARAAPGGPVSLTAVRARATLGRLEPSRPGALEALLEGLSASEPKLRQATVELLGAWQWAPPEAVVDALLALLASEPQASVRAAALPVLGGLGRAAEARGGLAAVQRALADPEIEVRQRAADALGQLCHDAAVALPVLVELLDDGEARVRAAAAWVVARFGAQSAPAVPRLVRNLSRDLDYCGSALLSALGSAGPAAREAHPELVALLERQLTPYRRTEVLEALRRLGTVGRAELPLLERALADTHVDVRLKAVELLRGLGPEAAGAGPALASALADAPPALRLAVVGALAALGSAEAPVVLALVASLQDPDEAVCAQAEAALLRLGPAAVAPVGQVRREGPVELRPRAVYALGKLGPPARAELEAALQSEDEAVRNQAQLWLG